MSLQSLSNIVIIVLLSLFYSCQIHSDKEIIKKAEDLFIEEEKTFVKIIELINVQDCGKDNYSIIYHGKSGEVSTIDSEVGFHFDCYDKDQKFLFWRLLHNYRITGIRVKKGVSISFGLKYSPEPFLHSGLIYLYEQKNVFELGMEIVSIGELPKRTDNWIYPINEHWYIYVPKKREE